INLPDMLLLRIVLKGVKGGLEFSKIFQVIDLYDEEKNITALSRTTGYTAAGVALLLAKKIIREKGVLPPEMIGFNKMYMNHLLKYLAERGVTVLEI
ncbi:MAG: saccharopine dehydrogenase, partial [Aigarchaeota archaeon]|nr:saccharopine dehydrogenase [Aigarchaeota archaeon]